MEAGLYVEVARQRQSANGKPLGGRKKKHLVWLVEIVDGLWRGTCIGFLFPKEGIFRWDDALHPVYARASGDENSVALVRFQPANFRRILPGYSANGLMTLTKMPPEWKAIVEPYIAERARDNAIDANELNEIVED
jgi:hypothetical protein